MADLTNAQIAAAFEELADLYELDGAVQYRVIAYRNAARTVRDSSVSVMQLARDGKVTELPNIGKTLEEKLIALDETGDIPTAVKLRAKIPVGLISVMRLPGFGPKRAKQLYDEIGVDSLDALRAAVEDGRLKELRGFGVKAQENLKKVLAEHQEDGPSQRVVLSRAVEAAVPVLEALRAHPAADRVEAAGSLRRWTDSVKDVDIIATASDPAALAKALGELELVESVSQSGDVGARVTTHTGLKIDLKVVEPDQFGNVLQHFTGSKAHNVALREAAVRRGLHVSEYGILDDATGETLRCSTEEEVYAALGLDVDPARAARGPRRAGGRGRRQPAGPDRGRRPARRPALAHDDVRRHRDGRDDGGGGARARPGVPGHHRPLGHARLRRPRDRRPAARADRGDPGDQRDARRLRAADRDRVQHHSPRARPTTPTTCWSSSTGSSPRSTPRSG